VTNAIENRRPLRSRETGWAKAAARRLAQAGASPDAVSAASVAFAALGGAALAYSGLAHGGTRSGALILGALAIQGRLVCNLLDGMVAVEHGRGGPHGAIWNELPDRVADVVLLAGAGYGAALAGAPWASAAGWAAAVAAVLTAYVRELGRALGAPADFSGPGAKPQRMALLTAAAAIAVLEPLWRGHGQILGGALALIAALAVVTAVRRTRHLANHLSHTRTPPREP
jgi:phosphatidylglycerophosphate synthase